MDLTTGAVSIVGINNYCASGGAFRLVGDETSVLSMAGDNLYVTMSQGVGGVNVSTGEAFHIIHETQPPKDGMAYSSPLAIFNQPIALVYSSESSSWHLAPAWAPASISGGVLYWIADGSAVAEVRP
jgi:hypothetical protein